MKTIVSEPKYICDQNWVKFPSLVSEMCLFDFGVKRSKVKVTAGRAITVDSIPLSSIQFHLVIEDVVTACDVGASNLFAENNVVF